MKILLITTYFEPDSGAAAVRLSRLACLLQKRGHEVTVLTTMPHYPVGKIADDYRGKFTVTEERGGVKVIRSWLWATPSAKINRKLISQISFMITAILRGISISKPDVVLIEGQPIFTNLAGRFICAIKRVPHVLNISDLWPDHLLSVGAMTETHPIYRIARKVVDSNYRVAKTITALTPFLTEKIIGYIGQAEKVHTVLNAVDLERFNPNIDPTDFREKHNLTAEKLVTFIGTFATQHDFDTMFEAARRLQNRTDTQFVLIGDGTQKNKVAQYNLPNVRHISWINHDEVPQAWAASYLLFWATHDHPLHRGIIPSKLYEATASGVPMVAAAVGVGVDIINESGAGITVPNGDIDGLTNAITHLLDNPNIRDQHAQAGRAYAEANFDPEKVADTYEKHLQNAIGDVGTGKRSDGNPSV